MFSLNHHQGRGPIAPGIRSHRTTKWTTTKGEVLTHKYHVILWLGWLAEEQETLRATDILR